MLSLFYYIRFELSTILSVGLKVIEESSIKIPWTLFQSIKSISLK